MSAVLVLIIILAAVAVVFLIFFLRSFGPSEWRVLLETAIGFLTNFFDTLGIGSFAPTTSLFKFFKIVPDEKIPGTLNVGHALPTVAEAIIFTSIIQVDPLTLISLIAAAVAGSWLGAGVVSRLPRRFVQIGMGIALLAAAALFLLSAEHLVPTGGSATGLSGGPLVAGIAINFCLGALMTLGIGLYAPCLIMIALLGMNPLAAFPIMMGSCAFLMPIASLRFIRFEAFSLTAAIGLTLGGIPAVIIAAFIVKHLPFEWVRWLVIAVVLYASIMMLRSAFVERARAEATNYAATPGA